MKSILMIVVLVLLVGCASQGRLYEAGLASVERQQREIAAAETERAQAQAMAAQACTTIADANAMGICMLGQTAMLLAGSAGQRSGGQQVVAPPQLPRSGWEILADFGKSAVPAGLNAWVALGTSEDAKDTTIATSANLYGYLRQTSSDTAATTQTALNGSAQVATHSVDAATRTNEAWANAAPLLRPSISVSGTGNVVGDHNALDQSVTGGPRVQGNDNALDLSANAGPRVQGNDNALDLSTTVGDRLQQSGIGNRQASDGPFSQDLECTLVTTGATGGNGGNAGSGGAVGAGGSGGLGGSGGAGTGLLRCAPSNGG